MSNFESLNSIPMFYDYENIFNASYSPSDVHMNSVLKHYYMKYLLEKVISVFEFDNLPQDWNKAYFLYVLFCRGFIGVLNTSEFGTICQHGTLYGRGIYYQPTRFIVSNPLLRRIQDDLLIGVECGILKLQPNYSGVLDIVSFYADKLALSSQAIDVNLLNSKHAMVYMAKDRRQVESYKKMQDMIINGEPMVVVDKDLFDEDGNPQWIQFQQNLKQSYIASDILLDMQKWIDLFNSEIGIPNANTEKRERMLVDEVNANNVETKSKVVIWKETLEDGLKDINDMFGFNISVKLRFEESEVRDYDDAIDDRTISSE